MNKPVHIKFNKTGWRSWCARGEALTDRRTSRKHATCRRCIALYDYAKAQKDKADGQDEN